MSQTAVQKLTEALRGPLVTHNWPEALKILQNAGQQQEIIDVVWKVGYELINKEPDELTRCSVMGEFYRKVRKAVKCLSNTEVAIDYISFCLRNGDIEMAKTVCQDLSIGKSLGTEKEDLQLQDQLQAYHGLVLYEEWKMHLQDEIAHNQSTVSEGSFSFLSEAQTSRMQARECAMKAVRLWTGIESLEGIWDSFIQKYVKVLLYSDKPEVAVNVLQQYSKNQPNNICAQKLLYQFYVDRTEQNWEQEIFGQLKIISELNAADPLVLEYCKYEKDDTKIIVCLFNLLDYPGWQHELKPWKMLAKYLENCYIYKDKGTEHLAEVLKGEWTHRQTWWPSFHFTKYIFQQDSSDLKMILQKFTAASILCGKETEYTKLAAKKLTEAGYVKKVQKITKFMLSKT